MPTEQRLGLEEVECVFPMSNATGQQDEPETVGAREAWPFDLPMEDDQLLPEQGVLGDELGSAAVQVGGKGGGRPDMAQAGGNDPAKLPEALASVRGPAVSCRGSPPAASTTQIVDLGHLLSDLKESPLTKATQDPSGEICASSTSRKASTSSGVNGRFAGGMGDQELRVAQFDRAAPAETEPAAPRIEPAPRGTPPYG